MKILQTADFHLKSDIPERFDVLEYVVKKAVKDSFDWMIICGDLFEDKVSANKIRPKVRALFDAHPKLKVILLPGNHDIDLYKKDKNYGRNVELINKFPFKVKEFYDWYLVFIPFTERKSFREIVQDVSFPADKTLIFAHGTLYDKKLSYIYEDLGDFAKYMPIYSWDVEDKARYLGLGHFHSKLIKKKYKDTLIAYSGSPVSTGSKCIGKREYIGIEINNKFKFFNYPIEIASYWENVNQHVYPGQENESLDLIEKQLKKLKNNKIMVNIKISGILDYKEEKFNNSLEKLKDKYKSFFYKIQIDNLTSDWSELISNQAVRNVIESLRKCHVEEDIKDKALKLTIDGFSKAVT